MKLLNYHKNDTVAVSLERPKTTALFFDKIWIPSTYKYSLYGKTLDCDMVPQEICIIERQEKLHKIEKKYKIPDIMMRHILQNGPFNTVEENIFGYDLSGIEYLFSFNRNFGLKQVVNSFKRIYGIEIIPIFINKTKFEESIFSFDEDEMELQIKRYNNNIARNKFFKTDIFKIPCLEDYKKITQCNVYEVCINYVPTIIEKNLDWTQVLEIRKDKKSHKKIKRFRYWINTELQGKSREEIIEAINIAIDDYKFALLKHGISTNIGGFTTILSSSSTIINALTHDFSGMLSAGFIVTAGIITYTASQLSEYMQTKRSPIAFIYDISKSNKH